MYASLGQLTGTGSFRFYADFVHIFPFAFSLSTLQQNTRDMHECRPNKIGSIAVNNLAAQSFGRFDFKAAALNRTPQLDIPKKLRWLLKNKNNSEKWGEPATFETF